MNPFLMIQAAGQVAAGLEGEGEEVVTQSIDLIELGMMGGWIMYPLLLMSIIAIYIFIERFMVLRRASNIDTTFMNRIRDYIHDGKIDSALALCRSSNHPIAR
ncbi:MAG TPA: MotA/TolQ/ExbB proton channel family protein, partial [Bacteroidales bacterium]|nr:MotA/TolQ/ExbB proton channel family protein [Bacteroidales bacterium]